MEADTNYLASASFLKKIAKFLLFLAKTITFDSISIHYTF
jgi:hypothetical protein